MQGIVARKLINSMWMLSRFASAPDISVVSSSNTGNFGPGVRKDPGRFYSGAHMVDDVSSGELIDTLVRITHGDSDARTQHLFRQNLQLLVGIAKMEQRAEDELYGVEDDGERAHRGTVH